VVEETRLRARLVLDDAREAATRLADRLASGGNWRVDWLATIALLRAVGHVLSKVDGGADRAKAAIEAAWEQWKTDPADAIFRDFIEQERNTVLKEYVLGSTAPAFLLKEDGGRLFLENGSGALLLEQPSLGPVEEALRWWEEQLDAIEALLARA
jgi:hypothetical protein